MQIRSVLKPEGSIMAGIGVMGTVYGIYSVEVGSVADAHVTPPNHPSLENSRKKAGWTAFSIVSALSLITRDGNVAILGYGSIIAMELAYRHAIMADPNTNTIHPVTPADYQPAGMTVVPEAS